MPPKKQPLGLANSLQQLRGEDHSQDDFRTLVQEAASLMLSKDVTIEQLKEQIPSLYQVVIPHHPKFKHYSQLYAVYFANTKTKEDALASAVTNEQLQTGILALAKELANAVLDYKKSANMIQQSAAELLCANIRRMRKAGRLIEENTKNDVVKVYLRRYDAYLESLGVVEKQIHSSLKKINEVKDGSEAYKRSCLILTKALKNLFKGDPEKVKQTVISREQVSFLEKLKKKFTLKNMAKEMVIAFIPDIYAAICPGISEAQMQAMVDLAVQAITLKVRYDESDEAFKALSAEAKKSLSLGGVSHQAPSAFFYDVLYDPAHIASRFFYNQFSSYAPVLDAAKDVVEVLMGRAFTLVNFMVNPFGAESDLPSRKGALDVNVLIQRQGGPASDLKEAAYVAGWMFYDFCRGLGGIEMAESRQVLFDHYFQATAQTRALSFEKYLECEITYAGLDLYFDERRRIKLSLAKTDDSLLALMMRLHEIQRLLSGMTTQADVLEWLHELASYHAALVHLKKDSNKECVDRYYMVIEKLQAMIPLFQERLLVPVIYDLVDSGTYKKEHDEYVFLAAMLKGVQSKHILPLDEVEQLIMLSRNKKEHETLMSVVTAMASWTAGARLESTKPLARNQLGQSIITLQRQNQNWYESSLDLLKPRLMIESIVSYLDAHIESGRKILNAAPGFEIIDAKLAYVAAVRNILQVLIDSRVLNNHKQLAIRLNGFEVPSLPDIRKRDLAKFLMRVADEFGPVAGGAGFESLLSVEKLMQFIIAELDSDVLTEAYRLMSEAFGAYSRSLAVSTQKDMITVWLADELSHPLDMERESSKIADRLVRSYLSRLLSSIYESGGFGGIMTYLRAVPGYAYLADQVSSFFNSADDKNNIKERTIDFLCVKMGVSAPQAMPHAEQLARYYFKLHALRFVASTHAVKAVHAQAVLGDDEGQWGDQLERLSAWVEENKFNFALEEDPELILDALSALKDLELRDHALHLFLLHCQNIHAYADECVREDQYEQRQHHFERIKKALSQALQGEYTTLFSEAQLAAITQTLDKCDGRRELRRIREQEAYDEELKALSASVKQNVEVLSPEARKGTALSAILYAVYYVLDAGYNAYCLYSVAMIVKASIVAFKAITAITAKAVFSAFVTGFMITPIGAGLLAARFLWCLGYQIFQQRNEFRKIWASEQAVPMKVLKTVGRSLFIFGCALVATLVTNFVVDKLRVLDIRKVGVFGWLYNKIKDKLTIGKRRDELSGIHEALKALKEIDRDTSAYTQALGELQLKINSIKYNSALKPDFQEKIKGLMRKQASFKGGSTEVRVRKQLDEAPVLAAKEANSALTWSEFVVQRQEGGVIHFSKDAAPTGLTQEIASFHFVRDAKDGPSSQGVFSGSRRVPSPPDVPSESLVHGST